MALLPIYSFSIIFFAEYTQLKLINWFVMSWGAMNSSISLLTKKCWTRIYGSILTLTLIKISILWHKLSNYILRLSPGQKPLLRLFEEAKSDNFPINFASIFLYVLVVSLTIEGLKNLILSHDSLVLLV